MCPSLASLFKEDTVLKVGETQMVTAIWPLENGQKSSGARGAPDRVASLQGRQGAFDAFKKALERLEE